MAAEKDPFGVAKADRSRRSHGLPSKRRRLAAAIGGPYHAVGAAVPGKKIKALRTLGHHTAVDALAGTGIGATIGLTAAAASRGRIRGEFAGGAGSVLGAAVGGHVGIQRAVTRNNQRGRYYAEVGKAWRP